MCFHFAMKEIRVWYCCVVVALAGCTTVPETGRRQMNLMPPAEEMQLGLTGFEQVKKETPINRDPAINALVQKVGQRIAAVAPLPNAQWEFVVFESQEANAFCLPGGKVGVYTGILPLTKDDAGLAAVLGHEVAHATLQHGRERMSEGLATQVIGKGLGTYVDAKDPRWTAAFGELYGFGSQAGVLLPRSRAQEAEADH